MACKIAGRGRPGGDCRWGNADRAGADELSRKSAYQPESPAREAPLSVPRWRLGSPGPDRPGFPTKSNPPPNEGSSGTLALEKPRHSPAPHSVRRQPATAIARPRRTPSARSGRRRRIAGQGHAPHAEEVRHSRRGLGRGRRRQARGRQGLWLGQRRRPPAGLAGISLLPGQREQGRDRRRPCFAWCKTASCRWTTASIRSWAAPQPLDGFQLDARIKQITRAAIAAARRRLRLRARAAITCTWREKIAKQTGHKLPIPDDWLIRYAFSRPLAFAPGTEEHYSNFGFFLCSEVIQRASGQPYEQYVRRRVLAAGRDRRHGTGAARPALRRQRGPPLWPRRPEGVSRRAESDRAAGGKLDRLGGGHGSFSHVPGRQPRPAALVAARVSGDVRPAAAAAGAAKERLAFRTGVGRGPARPTTASASARTAACPAFTPTSSTFPAASIGSSCSTAASTKRASPRP